MSRQIIERKVDVRSRIDMSSFSQVFALTSANRCVDFHENYVLHGTFSKVLATEEDQTITL